MIRIIDFSGMGRIEYKRTTGRYMERWHGTFKVVDTRPAGPLFNVDYELAKCTYDWSYGWLTITDDDTEQFRIRTNRREGEEVADAIRRAALLWARELAKEIYGI